jgi:hypothetical protein
LIAGRVLAALGATALTVSLFGTSGVSAAGVWFAICGVCTVVISLVAFGETVFFPHHVGDRRTALAASAFNVLLFTVLVAGWIWLPRQV